MLLRTLCFATWPASQEGVEHRQDGAMGSCCPPGLLNLGIFIAKI